MRGKKQCDVIVIVVKVQGTAHAMGSSEAAGFGFPQNGSIVVKG